ncbi:D-2-hydroxyacid dehydrogenase [Pseudooceanicola sp.]|uniref:D-2-hydroxyacid dehydrogenase n=1 Tax=Pseudooceanicola sp. TaxID=1914328 RepID=UPI00261EDFE5|nr:D-2-hydroxyacid dehydrogenase [Pseudooceanicola sp.]MDF1855468.1 D-2-hydroxyacid dehydrogenase [Pseudooceanicola sp.]
MANVMILSPKESGFTREIKLLLPDLEVVSVHSPEQAIAEADGVTTLITLGSEVTPAVLDAMPDLQWIQALSAGTDNILEMPGLRDGVAVTSLSGAHGPQMAELAILMMLALPRNLPRMIDNQASHKWRRRPQPILVGKRLCVLGLGAIAEALVARALPFGLEITGVSDGRSDMAGVTRIYPYAELEQAAAEADFLCILAPLSDRSRGIVNAAVLTALGPAGYLISMGRGPVIDEAALAEALLNEGIAGAGLDVFCVEPLPQDSPFWDLPNVIITPHVGGLSDRYAAQAAPIVAANLTAWATGGIAALTNRVR